MAKQMQRLDKVLANMGFGTRKEVKALVKDCLVKVDGLVEKDPGAHVSPEAQRIEVAGKELEYREFIYLMLNKPEGVVSSTEDSRDETVLDLLEEEHRHFELFPVGRLDKDTVGLLLLTNDGALAHSLLSPRRHVPKVYEASVQGVMGASQAQAFEAGVKLDDGYVTMPAKMDIISVDESTGTTRTLVTIMEGKYHQVKRMFQSVGGEVVHLRRIKMGPLTLDGDLGPGEYRELTQAELAKLRSATAEN